MPPKKKTFFPFKIYNKKNKKERKENINDYIICAIDPALKNCAIRIEGKNKKTLFQEKFSFVECRPRITKKNKESVKLERMNKNDKEGSFEKILEVFYGLKKELEEVDFIIIESQHHRNKDMLKVCQTIITVLMCMFQGDYKGPLIIEVEPKIKSSTSFIGLEDGIKGRVKKPELKKWAEKKGIEILKRNGDEEWAEKILKERKKDDHGDVICYTECWRKGILNEKKYCDIIFD